MSQETSITTPTMTTPPSATPTRPTLINQFASSDPEAIVSHYAFTAITGNTDVCAKCDGYSLQGDYTVWSFPDGRHKLRVEARVKSPRRSFKKRSIYGLGWGLDNGGKTESFGAVHSWDQDAAMFTWSNFNLKGDMTLDEIRKNPTDAQKAA